MIVEKMTQKIMRSLNKLLYQIPERGLIQSIPIVSL